MKTRIVRIGNSHGVRIPKPLIDQAGLCGEARIDVLGSAIVIQPVCKSRTGWAGGSKRWLGAETTYCSTHLPLSPGTRVAGNGN